MTRKEQNKAEGSVVSTDILDDIIDISEDLRVAFHPLKSATENLASSLEHLATPEAQRSGASGATAARNNLKKAVKEGDFFAFYKHVAVLALEYEKVYITCERCATCEGRSACDARKTHGRGVAREANKTPELSRENDACVTRRVVDTGRDNVASLDTGRDNVASQDLPENVVVLSCLADIPAEVWFALLADFPNVSVYLKPFSCVSCPLNEPANRYLENEAADIRPANQAADIRPANEAADRHTSSKEMDARSLAEEVDDAPTNKKNSKKEHTGEELYLKAISLAEAWAQASLHLIDNQRDINQKKRRDTKRAHFLQGLAETPDVLLQGKRAATLKKRIQQEVESYMKRLYDTQKEAHRRLNLLTPQTVGGTTFNNSVRRNGRNITKPASLTQTQTFLLSTLRYHPKLAQTFSLERVAREAKLCTLCGACQEVCPTHALQFFRDGSWLLQKEACTHCGACVRFCPVQALFYTLEPATEYLF